MTPYPWAHIETGNPKHIARCTTCGENIVGWTTKTMPTTARQKIDTHLEEHRDL